jgi:hypothetical protein
MGRLVTAAGHGPVPLPAPLPAPRRRLASSARPHIGTECDPRAAALRCPCRGPLLPSQPPWAGCGPSRGRHAPAAGSPSPTSPQRRWPSRTSPVYTTLRPNQSYKPPHHFVLHRFAGGHSGPSMDGFFLLGSYPTRLSGPVTADPRPPFTPTASRHGLGYGRTHGTTPSHVPARLRPTRTTDTLTSPARSRLLTPTGSLYGPGHG